MNYIKYSLKREWYQFWLPKYIEIQALEGYVSWTVKGYPVTREMFEEFMASPILFYEKHPEFPGNTDNG